MKMKNKKGQVPTTLTWFFGFVIIFLVIILFLTATLILAGRKKALEGRDEIELKFSDSKILENQRIFLVLINSEVVFDGEVMKIKDLLIKWSLSGDAAAKERIRERIEEILEPGRESLYVFDVKSEDGRAMRLDNLKYKPHGDDVILRKSTENFTLISDSGKINIKFYYNLEEYDLDN